MKLVITIILATSQTGCAVLTVASAGSYIATEQTLTDHAVTLAVPDSKCSGKNVIEGMNYCELRDTARTYNRKGY